MDRTKVLATDIVGRRLSAIKGLVPCPDARNGLSQTLEHLGLTIATLPHATAFQLVFSFQHDHKCLDLKQKELQASTAWSYERAHLAIAGGGGARLTCLSYVSLVALLLHFHTYATLWDLFLHLHTDMMPRYQIFSWLRPGGGVGCDNNLWL